MVRSEGDMSLKIQVTPPGIDPGTVRLVAQRLNNYASPGPMKNVYGLFDTLKFVAQIFADVITLKLLMPPKINEFYNICGLLCTNYNVFSNPSVFLYMLY
jgi:hypothetical protein